MEPEGSLPHSQGPAILSLSWARSIQSMPSHLTSLRSILILSSYKKFTKFCTSQKFVTISRRSLPQPILFKPRFPSLIHSIIIIPLTHRLRRSLRIPSVRINSLHTFLFSLKLATCTAHLILHDFITLILSGSARQPAAELKTGGQTAWKESPANCYG